VVVGALLTVLAYSLWVVVMAAIGLISRGAWGPATGLY
jgi:hypothetical protein